MNVLQRTAVLAAVCAGASPGALGVDVVSGIGLNYKNIDMSFEQDIRVQPQSGSNAQLDGRISQDMAFDAWQPFLQASLAAISGNYYVAINGETDVLDEGSDLKVDQQRSPGLAVSISRPYTKSVDVGRHDLGVTVGWRGIEHVALFGGFKYGKTEFDDDAVAHEFVASGPLLGASYTVPFDSGALTLGGAFARMSGRYDEDGSATMLLADEAEGDANGFSAFINWSAPLTERLRYLIDLRWQRYDFDGRDTSICKGCTNVLIEPQPTVLVDKKFSVRETLYGAGISLVYAL
jgi:hypothetical protein